MADIREARRYHASAWRLLTIAAALTAATIATARLSAQPQTREFPFVKDLGGALAEFDDGVVHAVAAYYHAQRNHDTPWLVVELGINSQKAVRVHRDSIELETPAGAVVKLASYRAWNDDVEPATRLLQAAAPTRHQVRTYFREFATFTPLRYFKAPHAAGTILDFHDLSLDQVFLGDLYFKSPTGAWARGRHVLVVHNAASTVRVPIELR